MLKKLKLRACLIVRTTFRISKVLIHSQFHFLSLVIIKTEFKVKMNFRILLLVSLVVIALGEDCPYCWQGCFPQVMTAGNKS
jgi:hypothetical protein